MARKIEHLKLAILQRLEYSQGTSDRQMEEIDKRVRQHLNSLDKLVKDRISSEKVETVQRMDKRMLQERMAFAEEIRKTEVTHSFNLPTLEFLNVLDAIMFGAIIVLSFESLSEFM